MQRAAFADHGSARLAVHFESIKETFTPYDTIFTFAEAYELSDSTLSSTCSLHTASSVKSLRNSPTQNLAGVKEEDVSESGTVRGPGSEAGTIRNSNIEAEVNEDVWPSKEASSPRLPDELVTHPTTNGISMPHGARENPSSATVQGLRPRTASGTDKDLPPTPGFSSPYLSDKLESLNDHGESGARSSIDTRLSSNSARPSIRELNRAYDYNRPKIKVGPRPSMESPMRPDTAPGDHDIRPVASLPSGVRMSTRKAVPTRPKSQQSQKMLPLQIPKIPSQGSAPAPPPVTPTNTTYPPEKKPSALNNGLPTTAINSGVKSPKMTPEKRRLMKALQIRQKHLAAQNATKSLSNDMDPETRKEPVEEYKVSAPEKAEAPAVEGVQGSCSTELQPQELHAEMPQSEGGESAKVPFHEAQDSPISAPEPSDGPSTQASSITDEDIPPVPEEDIPKAKGLSDDLEIRPGLEEIIRDQTQGPVISIESDSHEPSDAIIQHSKNITVDNNEDPKTLPLSPTQGQSGQAIEINTTRNGAQTLSISSTSTERTLTDKKSLPPVETEKSTENPPTLDAAKALSHSLDSTGSPQPVSLLLLPAETPKHEIGKVSMSADVDEPESPLLIEGQSVQTSASPSVVNLLDGLAATTHNESTGTAPDIGTAAPTQVQQPSLFNMIGGFGDSGELLDSPLSAVREETEISPSPSQSEYQAHIENLPQKVQVPLATSAKDDGESGEVRQPVIVEDEAQTKKETQSTNVEKTDRLVEEPPTGSTAYQKTRPRTTSKTFQFPSKSRSSSRGEKPPSLELSRDTEHVQGAPNVPIRHIPYGPMNNSQIGEKPKDEQQRHSGTQPEALVMQQLTAKPTRSTSVRTEKQSGTPLVGAPVPDALSHASSKALKLLGFSTSQSDPRPDVLANQIIEAQGGLEVATQADSKVQTEKVMSVKPDGEDDSVFQREILPESRSEPYSDVLPDIPAGDIQTQRSIADSNTLNLPKSVEQDQQTDRQARRRGIVEPVKRASTPEPSDEQFLSDDSFMEELKTATVQEAKPVSVSRSPMKPGFLGSEIDSDILGRRDPRTVSSPLDSDNRGARSVSSTRPSAAVSLRSFSGTIPPRPDVKTPPGPQSAQPKKFGVSSGISQRIKALEVKSSRPNSPNLPTPTTPGFLNFRKPSFNSEPNGAFNRGRASSAYTSPKASPEVGKSDPLNRSVTPRGDTVSVTATIVRDPADKSPWPSRDAANNPTVNLHESPLIVERQSMGPYTQQVMGPPQFSPLKPPRPRYSRYSSARSASSSSTEHKADGIPGSRRNSTTSKRSGRSSRNASEVDLSLTLSDRSLNPSTPLDGIKEEKKGSRSSRLLKRMSSITSMSRRSIAQAISPSPREGSIIEREEPVPETPTISVIDVGDINIQFPDTLLWKRRHMIINNSGILELSASKTDNVGPH